VKVGIVKNALFSSKKIPLVDLKTQYEGIRDQIDQAIHDTILNSAFIGGAALSSFEQNFAAYCGARHSIGVGNGTDALELVLEAMGIGQGDEVIVPSMTFAATAEAVLRVRARPVIVDIDANTLNIDLNAAKAAITPRTRALIAVHLYGQPADLEALCNLALSEQIFLVEDAAQAHGALWNGRPVGAIGHAGAFSFYPGKNLGAYGDGGAVVTNDDEIAQYVRLVANHGRADKYRHQLPGRNSRLDGLQAAILDVKLRHMDDWNSRRRQVAHRYSKYFADRVEVVTQDERAQSVFHLYVVQVSDRDRIREELALEGVSTGIHYPIPLHRQPAFSRFVEGDASKMWVADRVADRIISLPMFPELTDDDVDFIAAAFVQALRA